MSAENSVETNSLVGEKIVAVGAVFSGLISTSIVGTKGLEAFFDNHQPSYS